MSTISASESTATARVRGRQDRAPVGSVDEALSTFLSVRPRLFGVAYRILGSAADAEDIVQSVWLKWQMKDRSVVRDAAAFLTTTAVRLAVTVAHSAHARPQTDGAPWLPEPAGTKVHPELGAQRPDAPERTVLVAL